MPYRWVLMTRKKNSVHVRSRLNSFWIFYIYNWLNPRAQNSWEELAIRNTPDDLAVLSIISMSLSSRSFGLWRQWTELDGRQECKGKEVYLDELSMSNSSRRQHFMIQSICTRGWCDLESGKKTERTLVQGPVGGRKMAGLRSGNNGLKGEKEQRELEKCTEDQHSGRLAVQETGTKPQVWWRISGEVTSQEGYEVTHRLLSSAQTHHVQILQTLSIARWCCLPDPPTFWFSPPPRKY